MNVAVLLLLLLFPGYVAAQETQTAPDGEAHTGWLKVHLRELPAPEKTHPWIQYNFNAANEIFDLYVPAGCNPENPCGVLAWTNPDDEAGTPRRFEPLLNEYHLVAVSAGGCGNDRPTARRIGLLITAVEELSKEMAVDRKKLILSGFSGGGRISATGCFSHPEIWRGAISFAGGNFYKTYAVPIPVGASARGINDFSPGIISGDLIKETKKNVRFVLVTGSRDFNLNDSRGISRALKNEGFKTLLIEQPEMAHEVGSVESMRKALDFVLE